MRQIILDTETTGLRVEEGHRLIELGCVEMYGRKLTGKHFHYYFNPGREIDAGALAVHGISNEFLKDKPLFGELAHDFIQFITDAELIIHNAPFDIGFLNNELFMLGQGYKSLYDYCSVIDTLPMARKIHVGQRNSLDALCKRYAIDNSKRDLHGALMDAHLLAQVYLSMTGGQGNFFDQINEHQNNPAARTEQTAKIMVDRNQLLVLNADESELEAHLNYLEKLNADGKCVWKGMVEEK